jgi:hypothetical protein
VGSGSHRSPFEEEHLDERNECFFRLACCAIRDPAALQDPQAETTGRAVRITENVPVLRVDHISIKGMLPGVRSVSYSRERDSGDREIERRSSPHAGGFDRQKSET